MAEQLGLEQAFGQRAAVEREEQSFGPRGQLVEVAGDDFFTGARLPLDEHGALGRGHLLREPQHLAEEPRLAERLHLT